MSEYEQLDVKDCDCYPRVIAAADDELFRWEDEAVRERNSLSLLKCISP